MKVKAKKADDGFMFNCPQCGGAHYFSRINFRHYCLEGDQLDDFYIDSRGLMTPVFVCKNMHCTLSGLCTVSNLNDLE